MRRRPLILITSLLSVSAFGFMPRADGAKSALELSDTGWIDLLKEAGTALKGWSRGPIPPKAALRAKSPFKLDSVTGILLCDGRNLHEWLRFDTEFSNLIYHVEWRFVPVTSGKKGYNSGIYVRNSADAEIWHQAQAGGPPTAFLFGSTVVAGKTVRVNLSKSVQSSRVKPAGEWNVYEVTCRSKNVTLWCNGTVACVWNGCEVAKGFVGLEAEGYQIEFRKVLVKKLD